MEGRYLISTANENSWKFDRPVIFLGEWCLKHDRKHIWSNMDYIVADPYGSEKGVLERDHNEIKKIYLKLILEVSSILNSLHETEYGTRYWEIIIGHWMMEYITVVFNRYKTITNTLKNYNISGYSLLNFENNKFSFQDGLDFKNNLSNNNLNDFLYSKILSGVSSEENTFDFFNITTNSSSFNKEKTSIYGNLRLFFFTYISPRFVKKNDAFIIKSYLPFKSEFTLQMALGQFPQDWGCLQENHYSEIDWSCRRNLRLNLNNSTGFEFYIRKLFFDIVPTCYIEGYDGLVGKIKRLKWPSNPKFIFTSNSFQFDELFKIWVASKTEKGYQYYVGQHGSDYGTRKPFKNYVEFNTCDKFIAWGEWAKDYSYNKKTVVGFNFTVVNKVVETSKNGGLLLVQRGPGHRMGPEDNFFNHTIYQKEMFRLIKILPLKISKSVTVRLHKGSKIQNTADEYLWNKQMHISSVDMYKGSIFSKIKENRLTVFSYDSTGFLEALALNIPVIGFWHIGQYNNDMLLSYAKPFYDLLKEAEILAETPEDASKYISKHWDNVDKWWQSNKVQNARKVFCDQFSRVERKPISALKNILLG